MTEPPVVCLLTGKTSAVNTRLLAGSETDDGAVERVADTVGLSVFKSESSDSKVNDRLLGEL